EGPGGARNRLDMSAGVLPDVDPVVGPALAGQHPRVARGVDPQTPGGRGTRDSRHLVTGTDRVRPAGPVEPHGIPMGIERDAGVDSWARDCREGERRSGRGPARAVPHRIATKEGDSNAEPRRRTRHVLEETGQSKVLR